MYKQKRVSLILGAAFLAIAGTLLLLATLSKPAHASPLRHAQSAAVATTRYVATTGWDVNIPFTNDCTDPMDPCLTVQYAVDMAAPGDVILVATGVYTGLSARPVPAGYTNPPASGLVTQMAYITKTVTIQGGYTTANWSTPNPATNPTTLDAEGLGRGFVIAGDITPTVKGLHITNGDAAGLGGSGAGDVGGGIYVLNARATISENQIANNISGHGGGGVALYSSQSTFRGNTIVSNTGNYGGGLLLASSSATLDGNTVAANTANQAGGGLYLYASAATVSGNAVYSNTASAEGGGLRLYDSDHATLTGNQVYSNTASMGGGIEIHISDDVTLSGNTVQGNVVNKDGAGYGGGLYLYHSDSVRLAGNTVQGNIANTGNQGFGGGVYLEHSPATLSGNTVQGNVGSTVDQGMGGGLYLSYSSAVLNGNTVQGNVASTATSGAAGGLYLTFSAATLNGNTIVSNTATLNSTALGWGGGLYVRYSSPFTLTNNLIADNHANFWGSGVLLDGYSGAPTSGCLLHNTIANNRGCGQGVRVGEYTTLAGTNTIIAGHSSVGITVTAGSTVTLEATLWHANGTPTGGVIDIGTANVYDDPAFVNPAAWDYHLTAGSAAIDAGVDAGVTTDMDGDPRPLGAGYDIGADEYGQHVYLPLVLRNHP